MQTMQRTGAIEYKDIAASAMQVTSERQGIIEGLVSKTGNVDLQDDRVMYGAWRDTVKSAYARQAARDPYFVPFLWSHNFEALPPGGVFHLDETREGLFAKVKMNLEIQSGAELWASYKAGTVSKQSIGYRTVTSDYEKIEGKTVRNLRRCDLLECSGVVFPANPLASITSVKRYWPGYSARQKGNAMSVSVKDFNGRYAAEQLDDWQWSDWSDLTSALKASIDDCFSGGGDPLATFETDVAPQLLAALRSYIAEGVSLGYTGGSGMDMGMMSMFGAGRESKAGYLNASDHVAIKESSAMIMKHAKIIQSASANVE